MRKFILFICFSCFTFMAWGQNSELIRKAESGDAEAQCWLGHFYLDRRKEEAAKWYLKAAEQGHARAQERIGECYFYGWGVPKNRAKAESWFLKAAAQGEDYSYLLLGELYIEENKKDEAIYWFKRSMDAYYAEYGEELQGLAEYLRELGVYYHPASKSSSSVASASRSSSSSSSSSGSSYSSSSSSSAEEELLYEGTYTQSSQGYCPQTGTYTDAIGPGFQNHVKIYDSYITVNGQEYKYVRTSGAWKIYKSDLYGLTQYYKVNPNNFEMSYYTSGYSPLGGELTTVYEVKKGEAIFNIHQNNPAAYDGGYSTGGGTGSSSKTTTKTYQKTCRLCHGSGKCNTCNGKHRYLNPLTNKYVTCPNCRTDGRCSACGGTGKRN